MILLFAVKYFKTPNQLRLFLNCWPPLLGPGIKILEISEDYRFARVCLKFRWWNKNINRTQFGGSIFAMTDPMYPLLLMGLLGDEYYVWDKLADIDFIKPGHSNLYADFVLSDEKIAEIIEATANGGKYFPEFVVNILDTNNEVIARVRRKLYVRKKARFR